MTALTSWEAEELTSHLSSRPDLWAHSEENTCLWARISEDDNSLLCGLMLIPPPNPESPYCVFHVQEVSYEWDAEYTSKYVKWLIANWTTHSQRLEVEAFLREELHVDPETAVAAAIAIESFDWTDRGTSEPSAPPVQEEFWPRDAPPIVLQEDRTHIGTYLLSGGAGWTRLRLTGGMIRAQLSVRSKSGEVILLDGFVRPYTHDVRITAAKLAGWKEPEEIEADAEQLGVPLEESA